MINPLIEAGASAVKHAIMRTISVLCVIAVVALLGFSVWRIINPKPTQSYAQKAEQITNNEAYYYYDTDSKFFLGLKIFGFKFGLSKIITQEKKKEKQTVK